ncbi:MAG: RNA polymerase sigma factor [Muribaculaceae bacterium]|nr:RNA polymerase sigma factor [Muribaculaceae bacterium]
MEPSILTHTFLQLRDKLRSMAASIIGDYEEAEDAINDAFCRLWKKDSEVENELSATKLSYTAVKNSAIDRRRQRASHPQVSIDESLTIPEEEAAEERREKEELYNALLEISREALNEVQYKVFIMHDVENLPYPEITEKLGISQQNARTILSRARKTIREVYRKKNL